MAESSPSRPRLAQMARPQTPPPWSLVDLFSTILALAVVMLVLGPAVTGILFNNFSNPTPLMLLFSWLLGLLIITGFVWITRRNQGAALRLSGESRWPLPYALLVGVGAALTIDLVAGLIAGFQPTAALTGIGQGSAGEWLLGGLFVALMQPIAEGLIFQGVVLPRLRASFGGWVGFGAAAVVYTVYFAVVYGVRLSGPSLLWYGMIVPLFAALVLNTVRIYTESTRAAILAAIGMGLTFLLAAIALAG